MIECVKLQLIISRLRQQAAASRRQVSHILRCMLRLQRFSNKKEVKSAVNATETCYQLPRRHLQENHQPAIYIDRHIVRHYLALAFGWIDGGV